MLIGKCFNEKASFGYPIENMCIKGSRKLQAAIKNVAPYTGLSKRTFLMNAYFNSKFT